MASTKYIKQIYDPLVGKFIREIKPTDIFTMAQTSTALAAANNNFSTSSAATSNYDIYIHNVVITCSSNNATGYLTAGTSTVLPFIITGSVPLEIYSSGMPLFKVTGPGTLSVFASIRADWTAHVSGVREPKFVKVETSTA
jgi:hypothetical protein